MKRRARAIGTVATVLAVILVFLAFVPMPYYFRSEGVVRSEEFQNIYTRSPGEIVELVTPSGSMVEAGQVLVKLTNYELEHEAKIIRIQREQAELQIRQDRSEQGTELAGLKALLETLDSREASLKEQLDNLVVKAPVAGRWISDRLHEVKGVVVPRGQTLGMVRAETGYVFTAVVHQRDAGRLSLSDSELKIYGQDGETLILSEIDAIPAGQQDLPSPALGVAGGGSAGVAMDQEGDSATEPYFQVRGKIQVTEDAIPQHGQRGVARFALPKTPLLSQWSHALRQFFQKEYQY